MTSVPAILRLPTSGRSLVAAAVVALSATVAVAVATGSGSTTAQERLVRAPPRPVAAADSRSQAVAGSRHDDGVNTGAVAPRSTATHPAGSGGAGAPLSARWLWPLEPRPPVVRPYRAPLTTYGAGHRGLDLGAPLDATVRAVEAGVVTHAGLVGGRSTVTVTHVDGLRSTYEPLTLTVVRGARIETGDVLGTLDAGSGHCRGQGCLHLGARRGDAYLDPLPLLVAGRLALLPVGPGG